MSDQAPQEIALVDRWRDALMDNYGTPAIALVRGEGATVWDDAGKPYVDLYAGIATNVLGHAHPAVVEAVSAQVATLGHVSNFFATVPAVALAERLLALSGRAGKVYLCNSGAEANEAAFKLSRRTGRTHVVATEGAFHGRTMGALALTGQPAKRDAFHPLPGDVTHVPFGDVEALRAAVTEQTAMVILEPVIGEGGVRARPGRLPGRRPRDHHRHRHAAGAGRGADRHRADRQLVRLPGRGRRPRRRHAGQGARRRPADRRLHRLR